MNQHSKAGIAASMVVLMGMSGFLSGCATAKTHPDFAARQKDIHTIQVAPADVDAYEITFNSGNQPLAAAVDAIRLGAYEQAQSSMETKGYAVAQVSPADIEQNPALKSALFEMNSLYRKAIEDIAANKQKQFTYTVGSSPNAFADFKASDAIILVRVEAWKKSQGQSAADITKAIGVGVATLGMFIPRVSFTRTTMQIAVVDINLGDILWYNVAVNEDMYDPAKKLDMMKMVKDVLASFPVSSTGAPKSAGKEKKVSRQARVIDNAAISTPKTTNNFARTAG